MAHLPALVTIISVPSESNSSQSDFISSWAPTPSSLGCRGFSGLTAAVGEVPAVVSPGVVRPSPWVVSPLSDWVAGELGGLVARCCLSPAPCTRDLFIYKRICLKHNFVKKTLNTYSLNLNQTISKN